MPYYLDDTVEPSEIYYNIVIKNNITGYDDAGNPVPINSSVPLTFDEARTKPYLNNPKDYYMSVLSFEMDTQAVPVFMPEPVIGATDISSTIYWITITDASNNIVTNGHQNVKWSPEDLSAPKPPSPVPANFNEYPYYFGYTYSYFVELVNKALAAPNHTNGPPFLTIDGNLVKLSAPARINLAQDYMTDTSGNCVDLDGNPNPAGHKIFFNSELFYLFSSLSAIEKNEPLVGSLGGKQLNANFQLLMVVNPSGTNLSDVPTNFSSVPPSGNRRVVSSITEYPPFPMWNPVDTIVFTTSHLHIVPELIAANATTTSQNTNSQKSNAESYYILADYAAPLYTGKEYKPNITYQPSAEYKLSDVYGNNPVYQLKMNVYWKDKYGSLHRFLLESGGTASLKLLFRKKVFYLDF